MNKPKSVQEENLDSYDKVAKLYSNTDSLQDAEKVIFYKLDKEISGKRILDIGVGGGRTVPYLTRISSDYTGIDYSHAMVEECNKKHPDVNVFQCDARDMSVFKDEEFDLVFFSYNGIDSVPYSDRLKILNEIHRILKKGGIYLFSAHNKNCSDFKLYLSTFSPFITYNLLRPLTFNPIEILERFKSFLKGTVNHWRNSKHVIHTDEYSVINDKGHDYSFMMYYITIKYQKEQLHNIGFENNVMAFDRYGEEITNDSSMNTWIYYLARK